MKCTIFYVMAHVYHILHITVNKPKIYKSLGVLQHMQHATLYCDDIVTYGRSPEIQTLINFPAYICVNNLFFSSMTICGDSGVKLCLPRNNQGELFKWHDIAQQTGMQIRIFCPAAQKIQNPLVNFDLDLNQTPTPLLDWN